MRWSDINFSSNQWRISETKNGEPQTIPLVSSAVEILEARKKINDLTIKSEFVFAGNGATGHLQDPKKAWDKQGCKRVSSSGNQKSLSC